MKNLKKILIILMIALITVSFVSTNVYAATSSKTSSSKTTSSSSKTTSSSSSKSTTSSSKSSSTSSGWTDVSKFDNYSDTTLNESATNIIGAILGVLRTIGTGISIIMLIAVAIKYMSSAPGDRAEIKKHAVIYVVGAVVLFASAQIVGIIQQFATNVKV